MSALPDDSPRPPAPSNPLVKPLLDTMRLIRVLRQEALAYAELLQLALEQLHHLNRELDHARERIRQLLAKRRGQSPRRST